MTTTTAPATTRLPLPRTTVGSPAAFERRNVATGATIYRRGTIVSPADAGMPHLLGHVLVESRGVMFHVHVADLARLSA